MPLNRKLAILGRLLEPGDSLVGMLHFIASVQMLERYPLCYQLAARFQSIWDYARRTNSAIRLGHCYRNRTGVDIQTNKPYLRHATNSFRMRLCAAGVNSSRRNPRYGQQG
jgi:hypothetical protein